MHHMYFLLNPILKREAYIYVYGSEEFIKYCGLFSEVMSLGYTSFTKGTNTFMVEETSRGVAVKTWSTKNKKSYGTVKAKTLSVA